MTEENHSPPPTTYQPSLAERFRKVLFTFAILFLAWMVFAYVAPIMLFPSMKQNTTPRTVASGPNLVQKDEEIATLSQRIVELEGRLQAMETQPVASTGDSAHDARLSELQAQMEKLQASTPAAASAEQVNDMQAQLLRQEEAMQRMHHDMQVLQQENGKQMAIATAYSHLRDAIQRGDAFGQPLAHLQELIKGRTDIQELLEKLSLHAEKGIASMSMLAQQFETTIPEALSPDVKPDSLRANLRSLIRIRKVGVQEGEDDESIIARTEVALKEGRLAAAIQELSQLSPAAATAFANWKARAEEYLNAQYLLDQLQTTISSKSEPQATPLSPAESTVEPPLPMPAPEEPPAVETPEEEAPVLTDPKPAELPISLPAATPPPLTDADLLDLPEDSGTEDTSADELTEPAAETTHD